MLELVALFPRGWLSIIGLLEGLRAGELIRLGWEWIGLEADFGIGLAGENSKPESV